MEEGINKNKLFIIQISNSKAIPLNIQTIYPDYKNNCPTKEENV